MVSWWKPRKPWTCHRRHYGPKSLGTKSHVRSRCYQSPPWHPDHPSQSEGYFLVVFASEVSFRITLCSISTEISQLMFCLIMIPIHEYTPKGYGTRRRGKKCSTYTVKILTSPDQIVKERSYILERNHELLTKRKGRSRNTRSILRHANLFQSIRKIEIFNLLTHTSLSILVPLTTSKF